MLFVIFLAVLINITQGIDADIIIISYLIEG